MLKMPKFPSVPLHVPAQAAAFSLPVYPHPARRIETSVSCQGGYLDAIGEFFLGHHDGLCFADTCPVTGTFLGRTASTQPWLTQ